ncbi:hypothetical protein chiPu_0020681 [Chiloscyllium punctatum]|uniref:Ig-like domain-containing protein n=1 Tax=Chiloscyllium punctatum TaxID=137246 RepID=A0A401RI81_CHIPU|nr:hypothetical protein [Chiloscyllium punctatum]
MGPEAHPILAQFPKNVKIAEGGTVQIQCRMERSFRNNTVENYTVHWYHPGNKTCSLLTHYVNGLTYRSRGFSERFQLSRNVSSNSYILTIRELQLNDTNTYICGIWGNVFGKGTRLNVTSANVPVLLQSPSLGCVTEGHTAQLQCTLRNATVTHTDVHWYREQPGNNMETKTKTLPREKQVSSSCMREADGLKAVPQKETFTLQRGRGTGKPGRGFNPVTLGIDRVLTE